MFLLICILSVAILSCAGSPTSLHLEEDVWETRNMTLGRIYCDIAATFLPDAGTRSAVDGEWQNVGMTSGKLFVYSAFWEGPSSVRIVGTGTREPLQRVWCRVWYNESCSATVRAHSKAISEHHDLKFGACFIVCPLESSDVPHSVSIVKNVADTPTNRMLVIRNEETEQPISLSVCVKPIYRRYSKTMLLLEFLEMYSIQGAKRFTLYLLDAEPSIVCILRHYEAQGIVELLDWQSWQKTGVTSPQDVHDDNILASLNDCLYRHRGRSENVAVVDFDEFIVPQMNLTLLELIRLMDADDADDDDADDDFPQAGSYVFQNAFFYLPFPSDVTSLPDLDPTPRLDPAADVDLEFAVASRLVTVTKTRRRTDMLPHGRRSKYVCKPSRTVEAGNHFVWEHVSTYLQMDVGPEAATSHHYRQCLEIDEQCVQYSSHVDRSARRYQLELTKRVTDRWRALADVCKLGDLRSSVAGP